MRRPRFIPKPRRDPNSILDRIIIAAVIVILVLLWVLFYIIPNDRVLDAAMECTQDGGGWSECYDKAQEKHGNFLTHL